MKGDSLSDQTPPALCVRGCIRKGTEDTEHPDYLVARHGHYCQRCYSNMVAALDLVPELMVWLVEQFVPLKGGVREFSGSSSASPWKEPLNATAFETANLLYQLLAYTARSLASTLGLPAPRAAVGAWRDGLGAIIGLPGGPASSARYHAGAMSMWIRSHLEEIYALPEHLVDAVDPYLKSEIWRVASSWPREMRSRYSEAPHMSTGCGGRIAIYPPRFAEDEEAFKCERCGAEFDVESHLDEVREYVAEQKRQQEARVAVWKTARVARARQNFIRSVLDLPPLDMQPTPTIPTEPKETD